MNVLVLDNTRILDALLGIQFWHEAYIMVVNTVENSR